MLYCDLHEETLIYVQMLRTSISTYTQFQQKVIFVKLIKASQTDIISYKHLKCVMLVHFLCAFLLLVFFFFLFGYTFGRLSGTLYAESDGGICSAGQMQNVLYPSLQRVVPYYNEIKMRKCPMFVIPEKKNYFENFSNKSFTIFPLLHASSNVTICAFASVSVV